MKKNKLVSILLIFVMCLQILPTTAFANDLSANTSQYFDSMQWLSKKSNGVSLFMLDVNGKTYKEFEFDPAKTEYDIVLPDTSVKSQNNFYFTATRPQEKITEDDNDASYNIGGLLLTDKESKSPIRAGGNLFSSATVTGLLGQVGLEKKLTMSTHEPVTLIYQLYKVPSNVKTIATIATIPDTYISTDVIYTFNFYRRATLTSFTAAYADGTEVAVDTFDAYSTNITLNNVAAGTKKLLITAPAVTQTDTVLKFDNGSGVYDTYKIDNDVQVDKYELDITKYENGNYKQAEGYYVIPFMLDYAGNDSNPNVAGVDGYYTLTINFAEEEKPIDYTPKFTKEPSDITAKVGGTVEPLAVGVKSMECDNVTPLGYQWYSADNPDGNNKTALAGATAASYTPPVTAVGTTYYFCEVTRTVNGETHTSISNSVKVTVLAEGQTTQGRYIKNIIIKNNNDYGQYDEDYIIFDNFNPQTSSYDVMLPYGSRMCDMATEVTEDTLNNRSNIRWNYSLETADGDIVKAPGVYGYQISKNSIFNLFSVDHGEPLSLQKPGNYIYKLKIYEKDENYQPIPGTVDEYTFNITVFAALQNLKVLASGKELTLQPAFNPKDYHSLYVWEYNSAVPAGTKTITLIDTRGNGSQSSLSTGLSFVYNGQDRTADFQNTADGGGVEVDLTQCAKDENGAFLVPFSIVYGEGENNPETIYKLHISEVAGGNWQITKQPQGGTYNKGDKAELTVATNASEGEVTYQWQVGANNSNRTFTNIEGATSATYAAPTNYGGSEATKYYRCAITDKAVGTTVYSDYAKVEVNLGQVSPPVITYQPGKYTFSSVNSPNGEYKTTYQVGEKVEDAIQACVQAPEGDASISKNAPVKVEMQWYYNTKPSIEGATVVDSSMFNGGSSFNATTRLWQCAVPNTLSVGEHYYYFVATAVSVEDETNRASVTSDFVKITIVGREELDGFEGKGTEEEPYLIKTVADLKKIDEYVLGGDFLGGAVFKLANDIELPPDWEPIGENNGGQGKNLLPFSGTIDGDGHKLTVAEGGRPLLEYCRDAVVRNLDIYGKKINGAGLLEKGTIDYGTDGIYQELTDPDVITLENVKLLSGSQTRHSGLVYGGFTSGINDVIIKNCVIEPDVIVGYDKQQSSIGSFVGTLNGRIENSISYAEVYGVNLVGGLAADKGQSMGACEVVNSAFLGKLEASGSVAGGILASGYVSSSAPSTPPVTIRNCYVAADITANGGAIGGILGSEAGAIGLRNKGAIRDNHFYGTITDTNPDTAARYKDTGGILGKSGKYNADLLTYANNYYLANANYNGLGSQTEVVASWQPDKDSFIAKTAEEFANGDVLRLLNEGEFKNWQQDAKYPVVDLSKVVPVSLTISGEYKNSYYIGDELDLSGAAFILNMSDGSKQTLNLADIEITGYDKNTRAVQTVTASYGAVSVNFEITVLKRPEQNPSNPSVPGVDPNIIRVYFTLMGDSVHGAPAGDKDTHTLKGKNLQTWIARRAVDVDLNATVLDVFEKVLAEVGMTWKNTDGNYIEAITYNGQTLAEFSNGNLSGWMYTLNGEHVLLGVSEQFLENNDVIVFHYTDDYTVEKGSAELIGGSAGNKGTGSNEGSIVLQPGTILNAAGQNEASVTANEVNKAITSAQNDSLTNIVIEPNVKGSEPSIVVKVALDGAKAIAEAKMGLTVNTRQGSLVIGEAALKSIAAQAGGIDIRVNVEAKDTKADTVKNNVTNALRQAAASLRGAAESLIANACVTEVSITSNGKAITSFDGHELTVNLPVNDKSFTKDESYKVVVVSADGRVETVTGKCLRVAGELVVQVKVNHLSTFIVLDEKVQVETPKLTMKFADVTEANWFYEAVKFVYEAGLMNGENESQFMPNGSLNRAMLVTILYRLENQPEVTADNRFTDVKAGQWYTEAVIWASGQGIVNGYEDGTFKPAANVSREEMAAMLMRYAEYKRLDVSAAKDLSGYNDSAKVAGWAAREMSWANAVGLIRGDENNSLNPQGKATRAEAATILMRLVQNVIK